MQQWKKFFFNIFTQHSLSLTFPHFLFNSHINKQNINQKEKEWKLKWEFKLFVIKFITFVFDGFFLYKIKADHEKENAESSSTLVFKNKTYKNIWGVYK